ncbi:MAG: imidazole glycerol phosphate synthase subunit HisH, partial [Candidatus Omnitrophica bacterium]|nr:imidazole glycerol phosphate synthase subunit HisH [Candidatus Omnitrophota bacterium]
MDRFIAVIDYGLGNLRSVSKALEAVGARAKVTNEPEDIARACAIVLPGVGAFKRAMDNLTKLEILPSLLMAIKQGRPFLG